MSCCLNQIFVIAVLSVVGLSCHCPSLSRMQVGEIVDRAQKEEKMEQALVKLKDTWTRVEFQFHQFKDTQVGAGAAAS